MQSEQDDVARPPPKSKYRNEYKRLQDEETNACCPMTHIDRGLTQEQSSKPDPISTPSPGKIRIKQIKIRPCKRPKKKLFYHAVLRYKCPILLQQTRSKNQIA